MTNLEKQLALWHEKYYGVPNIPATYRKLLEEVGELGEAIMAGGNDQIAEESADVGIVLTHLLRAATGQSLVRAMTVKADIIETRRAAGNGPKRIGKVKKA